MKKLYLSAIILILGIIGVEGLYLTQANTLASESVRAEELKAEISELEERNQILESEVLSRSSLQLVSSRAAEMGFEKPNEFISLKDMSQLAAKNE